MKLFCLFLAFVLSSALVFEDVNMENLEEAVTVQNELVFEDESVTPAIPCPGYPRFESYNDTLLLFNDGYIYKSSDNGTTMSKSAITKYAEAYTVAPSGKAHALSLENWQGFVCMDKSIMVSYRARTRNYSTGEFYTSIRVMTSNDGGNTFKNEVVIAEATNDSFHGYWEPYMIQPDENTVLLFYSDDLNVPSAAMQNIVYHEYDVKSGVWSDAKVALNGVSRISRDGMPVITKLKDGGYAMVVEIQDYHNRFYNGLYGKSVFVIGLSLSKDGREWSVPIPVVAPSDIKGGNRCAAPYITTLPDGRVIISYMTEDGFNGTRVKDEVLNCVYGAVISDSVISVDSVITPTVGGPADGFSYLPDIFDDPVNGYMIWNTVFCDGEYVYFCGDAGTNDHSTPSSLRIRRAKVN